MSGLRRENHFAQCLGKRIVGCIQGVRAKLSRLENRLIVWQKQTKPFHTSPFNLWSTQQSVSPPAARRGVRRMRDNEAIEATAAYRNCWGWGPWVLCLHPFSQERGLGQIILIDRDIVEITNLQRQIACLTEDDAHIAKTKGDCCKRSRLQTINSSIN